MERELDLDALLEAEPSDEDDDNLSQLGRSIEDILNDAEADQVVVAAASNEDNTSKARSEAASQDSEKQSRTGTRAGPVEAKSGIPPLKPTQSLKEDSIIRYRSLPLVPSYAFSLRPNSRPGAALAAAAAASRQLVSPGKGYRRASLPDQSQLVAGTSIESSVEQDNGSSQESEAGHGSVQEEVSSVVNEDITCQEQAESGWDEVVVEVEKLQVETEKLPEQVESDEVAEDNFSSNQEEENVGSAGEDNARLEDMESLDSDSQASETTVIEDEGVDSIPGSVASQEAFHEPDEQYDNEEPAPLEAMDPVVDAAATIADGPAKDVPTKPLSPLEEAEALESGAAFSGLNLEAGAAARPMQLEGIQRGPPAIGLLQLDWRGQLSFALSSVSMMRDHGSPRALAIHSNYIAIGMSKGTLLLAPSRYSATRTSDDSEAKVALLNNVADKSQSSVTVLCFNLTGDLLLVGYANGTVTLWDVTRGVLAKTITGEHSVAVVHAAFVGHDFALGRQMKAITADCKGVVLLHTFTLVPLFRRFSVMTQCLLDGQRGILLSLSTLLPDESSGNTTAAAGAPSSGSSTTAGNDTGRKFLFDGSYDETGGHVAFVTQQVVLVFRFSPSFDICANLPRPDGVPEGAVPYTSWRRIRKSDEDPLLALAWGKKVFILQLQKELQLQKKLKLLVHWDLNSKATGVAWLSEQMLVVATANSELFLFTNDGTELEKSAIRNERGGIEPLIFHTHFLDTCNNPEKVYANSVGVRGAAFYFLGPSKLWRARLLPWQDRIKALQDAGDWMGAFQIAMELYDGKARGVTGLPAGLDSLQQAICPNLLGLLSAYIDEAFAYVRLALGEEGAGNPNAASREQYARVGGVAIEFCVHINRTDVLFENVFRKFQAVGQGATFLELLEPYILKDMLGGLAPEIMQSLVEHYSRKGWLQRVEQCILHMNIGSLDFNQVMKLCREHGLFSALIYLLNKGLNDFQSPVDELLTVARDANRADARRFGYKLLIYLKYCFSGLAFPPGRGSLPPDQLPDIQAKLLRHLVDPTTDSTNIVYPRLHYLLTLDAAATLEVLSLSFSAKSIEQDFIQLFVDALVHIVETAFSMSPELEKQMPFILEFIARFVSSKQASIPPSTLRRILEYLSCTNKESLMLSLLKALPEDSWDPDEVLQLTEDKRFWQVASLVHTRKGDYAKALEHYMKDTSRWEDTFLYVFSVLDPEAAFEPTSLAEFRTAVLKNIPELVQRSRDATLFLVLEYFHCQLKDVLKFLEGFPTSLYYFLKAIIEVHSYRNQYTERSMNSVEEAEGKLKLEPWSDRIQLTSLLDRSQLRITDEMVEFYLELMCQFEPTCVLKFLQSYESYRLEQCLKLCQKYHIKDGTAFLLERVGDVGGALTLILEDLSVLVQQLDNALVVRWPLERDSLLDAIPEVSAVHTVKDAAVVICQRNTFRLDSKEAKSLWFLLLDKFIHPLKSLVSAARSKAQRGGKSSRYSWRVLSVDPEAEALLRMLFSKFVGDVVTGMIGYVSSHEILNKIVSEYGNHEFGDFKDTILEMLNSYGYELSILGTAKRIVEADMFHNMVTLRRGRTRGFAPKLPQCSLCKQDQSGAVVHIFACEHLAHLDCLDQDITGSGTHARGSSNVVYRCPECSVNETPGAPSTSFFGARQAVSGDKGDKSKQALLRDSFHKQAAPPQISCSALGISRYELLKSLQRQEDVPGISAGPKLMLSPPVTRRHPSSFSSTSTSTSSKKNFVEFTASVASTSKPQKQRRKVRVLPAMFQLGRRSPHAS